MENIKLNMENFDINKPIEIITTRDESTSPINFCNKSLDMAQVSSVVKMAWSEDQFKEFDNLLEESLHHSGFNIVNDISSVENEDELPMVQDFDTSPLPCNLFNNEIMQTPYFGNKPITKDVENFVGFELNKMQIFLQSEIKTTVESAFNEHNFTNKQENTANKITNDLMADLRVQVKFLKEQIRYKDEFINKILCDKSSKNTIKVNEDLNSFEESIPSCPTDQINDMLRTIMTTLMESVAKIN